MKRIQDTKRKEEQEAKPQNTRSLFPLSLILFPIILPTLRKRKRRLANENLFAFLVLLPDLTVNSGFAVLVILPCDRSTTCQQVIRKNVRSKANLGFAQIPRTMQPIRQKAIEKSFIQGSLLHHIRHTTFMG